MASRNRLRNAADDSDTAQDVAGLGARRVAVAAVADLLGQDRPPALDEALAAALRAERLEPGDAALARAITVATFRRLGQIRTSLAERLDKGLPTGKPRLLALLATGCAQILDLAVPDHAAVDLAVRLAKADHRTAGYAGMVNAVLRRVAREREAILSATDPLADNTPDWLSRRWTVAYGAETAAAIARAHLSSAPIDLTLRHEGDAGAWAERLGATLLPTGSLRLPPDGAAIPDLPGFGEAAWWVQDAAAAIPARLLGVGEGERVLDLCAAPGGKTMQLASRGAAVTALDRSAPRLERLRENLARLGLRAEIAVADATAYEAEPFDAVLLDAPCSATGTIRRHPDVAWSKDEGDIVRLAQLQGKLLDRAARLVRPGGRLVYCTCSLERAEGEAQVAAFLARNARFTRVPLRPEEVGGRAELIDGQGDLRTLPSHGLDGFFASRLVRAEEHLQPSPSS